MKTLCEKKKMFCLIQNNFFHLDLPSENALNLDWSKILSFGKGLMVIWHASHSNKFLIKVSFKMYEDWLVILRFNATVTAKVILWRSEFPGFLTPVLTQISFQSHRLLFSYTSAEVRGEIMPERNFASTGSRTQNYQVMSLTHSPLSHPGRPKCMNKKEKY